jgi:hypothetical protein
MRSVMGFQSLPARLVSSTFYLTPKDYHYFD